jgi:hypothetical protein
MSNLFNFKGMSAMIFLRRLWKIPQLTTSIRLPNYHVNIFWLKQQQPLLKEGHLQQQLLKG